MSDSAQIEALMNEIAGLRAKANEDDELVSHLRARTATLNLEVRVRDVMIAERDRKIAALEIPEG